MTDSIELPCTTCGFAAVQLNLKGMLKLVPAAVLLAAKGAARFGGASLADVADSPTFGREPLEIAQLLDVQCISCTDAAAGLAAQPTIQRPEQVDNNPEIAP